MFGFKKKKAKKSKHLFAWRLSLSKLLGLAIGMAVAGYFLQTMPGLGWHLVVAIVLWFMLEGGLIGVMGLITHHPVWKKWPMPAWFRGLWIGMFMHVLLGLFLYDLLPWNELIPAFVTIDILREPLVAMAIEGAILGLLWDSLITAATGQGKPLLKTL